MPIPHSATFSGVSAGSMTRLADPRHRRVRLCRRGARPAPACATGTPSAASPARASACRPPAPSSTTSCSATRRPARARRGARRRRRRLLPDPLDGGRGRRFAGHRAPPGRGVRRRGGAPPACGGSSTSAACCRTTARRRATSRSRLAVEQALLDAVPESVALRASIVIAARSRSFRFLVRLIERLPVLALPAWRVEPHAAGRRARRARVPGRRGDAARAPRRPRLGHRRPGRDELRARCSSASATS